MFGDIGKMMEMAQTVDFDRLGDIPNQLDALLYEQRVTNILLGMVISEIGGERRSAGELLAQVREIARGE